jgi:hypothetical protein
MKECRFAETLLLKGFDQNGSDQKTTEYEEDVHPVDMPEPGKPGEVSSNQRISIEQDDQHDGNHAHHIESEDALIKIQVYTE